MENILLRVYYGRSENHLNLAVGMRDELGAYKMAVLTMLGVGHSEAIDHWNNNAMITSPVCQ